MPGQVLDYEHEHEHEHEHEQRYQDPRLKPCRKLSQFTYWSFDKARDKVNDKADEAPSSRFSFVVSFVTNLVDSSFPDFDKVYD